MLYKKPKRRTGVDNTDKKIGDKTLYSKFEIDCTTHSIVLPLLPSTYWPLMNKPVLKEVLPLYTGVSHSYENDPGMEIQLASGWEKCGGGGGFVQGTEDLLAHVHPCLIYRSTASVSYRHTV